MLAHGTGARIRWQYPDSAVITPKYQKQLKDDYRARYGREHDDEHWLMLCALRAITLELAYDELPAGVQDLIETAIAKAEGRE